MAAVLRAPKPRLRGWFHQVAFFVSIPAGVTLAFLARGVEARTAAIVYSLSLSAVFGSSAAYHRIDWSSAGLRRMKRLDHSMIFLLIAGSYTPVAVLVLHGAWSIVMLAVVWSGAALGITLKVAKIDGLQALTGFLYITLGWLAVFALPEILDGVGIAPLILLVMGGLLYTVGAIVLLRKRPDPSPRTFGYHEVWHSLMTGAAACHWAMILLILRAAGS